MLVLDTNHLRELAYATPLGLRLMERLAASGHEAVTTAVCAEEIMKGRLGRLAAAREVDDQVAAYERMVESIAFLSTQVLLPWDRESAERFAELRKAGVRIGATDLRIACIVLEHDATLLTRNTVDFSRIPSLRFENWLD
jgi:tRNA(fMet)-specific endonuclease VapC